MHRHRTPILGIIATIAAVGALVAASLLVLPARATPPSPEVTTTPIGMGRFTNIDTNVKTDIDPGAPTKFWRARIKAKRSSDLYVLENTIPPGKTFGWHRHPGPSLVIVKSGTACRTAELGTRAAANGWPPSPCGKEEFRLTVRRWEHEEHGSTGGALRA